MERTALTYAMDGLPHNLSHVAGRSGLMGTLASHQVARREQARKVAEQRATQPDSPEAEATDAPVAATDETARLDSDLPRRTSTPTPQPQREHHLDVTA